MGSARLVVAGAVASCLAVGLMGCGAQGQTWLEAPAQNQAQSQAAQREPQGTSWLAEDPPPPPARPRLNRVLTLGQSHLPSPETPDAAAPAPAAPTVVQINNNVSPQIGVWAPWRGWRGAPCLHCGRRGARGRAPAAKPSAHPGRDWPAVTSHGPAFPYSAPPGDAWSGRLR